MNYGISKEYPFIVVDVDNVEEESLLLDPDSLPIILYSKNYEVLRGIKINAELMAKEMVDCICAYLNSVELVERHDLSYDDVRFAAYLSSKEDKFVSVCIQDFDIADYIEENFVRDSGNDVVEFYRYSFSNLGQRVYDADELCEKLCDIVCKYLNNNRR